MAVRHDFWITNATLVTQDAKRSIYKGHVRVTDGRIKEISKAAVDSLPQTEDDAIDCAGETLFPGFVQAHVHLCQTLFRNQADDLELLDWLQKRIWPMEAAHTAETLYASSLLGIYELLASGTTTILDMATVRHSESVLEAVRQTGIRASVGKCLMDHPQTTPEILREPTARALEEARDLYTRWHGRENDRIRISYAPRFVISCTEDLLKAVQRLAIEGQTLIHTHSSENAKEVEWVRNLVHCENVEYLHRLKMTGPQLVLAHCIWLKDQEVDILAGTGTHVVHCPSSNLKLASGIAPVPRLLDRDINVALGADGAPCNNNLNIFQEMRLAALIHKVQHGPRSMPAQTVLDMATLHGARALGWDRDIGSIEVGKKADLVAMDLKQPENQHPSNPVASLVYSCQPQHLQWTMVDGEVVFKQGSLSRISTFSLMQQVEKAHSTLKQRLMN